MTKVELIRATAEKADATIKDTKVIVDALYDVIAETLVAGESITINGFGKYHTVTKDACVRRNPHTGESVNTPEKRYPKFKYSETMKTMLNA